MPKGIYTRTKDMKTGKHMATRIQTHGIGENNYKWKGDKVAYRGLHRWIQNNYGSPMTCEHCQKTNLTGHFIHWANKDGKYKRDRADWLRLCAKCHTIFDKLHNLRKTNEK